MKKEEVFEDLTEEELIEEYESKSSKRKKYLVFFMAAISILLMASYVYLSFPVYDSLAGRFESSRAQGNMLIYENITVILEEDVLSEMQRLWQYPEETPLCLQGEYERGVYHITSAYEPAIFSQGITHVNHENCVDSIILFHTHPIQRCSASRQDMQMLRRAQEEDPRIGMLIMCDEDRFSFYN